MRFLHVHPCAKSLDPKTEKNPNKIAMFPSFMQVYMQVSLTYCYSCSNISDFPIDILLLLYNGTKLSHLNATFQMDLKTVCFNVMFQIDLKTVCFQEEHHCLSKELHLLFTMLFMLEFDDNEILQD
jgi:hypothetical protein